MLQKKLTYKNSEPRPSIIHPNSSMEELQLDQFMDKFSSYLCLVVFKGALEPLSSLELISKEGSVSNGDILMDKHKVRGGRNFFIQALFPHKN